jgi:phage-related protein
MVFLATNSRMGASKKTSVIPAKAGIPYRQRFKQGINNFNHA